MDREEERRKDKKREEERERREDSDHRGDKNRLRRREESEGASVLRHLAAGMSLRELNILRAGEDNRDQQGRREKAMK